MQRSSGNDSLARKLTQRAVAWAHLVPKDLGRERRRFSFRPRQARWKYPWRLLGSILPAACLGSMAPLVMAVRMISPNVLKNHLPSSAR